MEIYRLILPAWAEIEFPYQRKVLEGQFTKEELLEHNAQGYNVYYLPNRPSSYTPGTIVDGSQIDTFEYVFVDFDLKENKYESKEAFTDFLFKFSLYPSRIVDSGNGIHVYWKVSDLDAMSFLKLQRKLMRYFKTDEAVAKIYQLMRVPGTINTKRQEDLRSCDILDEQPDIIYTAEQLDKALPLLTREDEAYCQQHYNKTYNKAEIMELNEKLPPKFGELLRRNQEAKDLFSGLTDDRSTADYRLGHILHANAFSQDEARSVLVNTAKAVSRATPHRLSYAQGIIDKVWTYELTGATEQLSSSVKDILTRSGDNLKGTRFPCHKYIDATAHGFRLGQIIGLVAGSGVGKTAMSLNMFEGFVKSNPDFIHFFVPLEQPANEIAERWKIMCGDNTALHDKVHILSNYNSEGGFRHLSLDEIKDYLMKFKKETNKQIGCVVIDHIGALKKKGKHGENQDLMEICHAMKGFAVETNTMLVMQSQAPREKAGIGDLELNKDSAYGTVFFESYCDYLVTIWQPLKRCYGQSKDCPTATAFKFCKIRHKKRDKDYIQEDVCYRLMFDSETEHMRELTQAEEKRFDFWNGQAIKLRGKDRKTDVIPYQSINWTKNETP